MQFTGISNLFNFKIFTVADTVQRMARWESKYVASGMPSIYPLTQGCDYATPTYIDPYFLQDWNKTSQSNTSIGYSTVKEFLDNLTRSGCVEDSETGIYLKDLY
jgi:hypothetical protein